MQEKDAAKDPVAVAKLADRLLILCAVKGPPEEYSAALISKPSFYPALPVQSILATCVPLECQKNMAYFLTHEDDCCLCSRSDHEARAGDRTRKRLHA